MEIRTYKEEDLIPLSISVLDQLLYSYLVFTMKFIIEHIYPDLKGLIATEVLDETSYELLESSDDELQKFTFDTADAIVDSILSLTNIYGFDLHSVLYDAKIRKMKDEVYVNTVMDDFPRDGEFDDDGNPEPRLFCRREFYSAEASSEFGAPTVGKLS